MLDECAILFFGIKKDSVKSISAFFAVFRLCNAHKLYFQYFIQITALCGVSQYHSPFFLFISSFSHIYDNLDSPPACHMLCAGLLAYDSDVLALLPDFPVADHKAMSKTIRTDISISFKNRQVKYFRLNSSLALTRFGARFGSALLTTFYSEALHLLAERISDGGMTPATDTNLLLTACKDGSHPTSDIKHSKKVPIF